MTWALRRRKMVVVGINQTNKEQKMGMSIIIQCDDCGGNSLRLNETKSTNAYNEARAMRWEVIGRRTTCPACVASRLMPLEQGFPIVLKGWSIRQTGTTIIATPFNENLMATHATLSADGGWVWENVNAIPRYVRHYVQTGVLIP